MVSGTVPSGAQRSRPSFRDCVRPAGWVNPTPVPLYDLVILGGGPAGLAAAADASARGAKVALVERAYLGGVSLLTGSIPSKAIIRAARLHAELHAAEKFGALTPGRVNDAFPATMERMRRLRTRFSEYHSAERIALAGIDLYFGAGHFSSANSIRVESLDLRFSRALVVTGARPAKTVVPGLEDVEHFTVEEIFELRSLPRRLLVIGGGPSGCELAQAFCRLGSHVAIVQDEPKFLPREERDAAQILSERLARDGVEIHLNTRVVAVRSDPGGEKQIDIISGSDRNTLSVDCIMVGVGRTPNVEGLGLESAGIACCGQGIKVDDHLRTSNPLVYAAGDVCLEHRFTHVAEASARLATANAISNSDLKFSALTIPWCTYTDPEIAHVGLYVSEARDRSIPVRTYTVLMHDVERAAIDGDESGFVKIHVRDGTDQILGATIVASHAGEMINEITLAMSAGLGLPALAKTIRPYPTESSAIRMAADAFVKSKEKLRRDPSAPEWPTQSERFDR
jgi:pyruvate/2-oxoglutarate dehydrogenase complex dihydrolipoamide dehydrogenase (E3) component